MDLQNKRCIYRTYVLTRKRWIDRASFDPAKNERGQSSGREKISDSLLNGFRKASVISEILPDCIQVADRFHLLQNLLEYMNDIFKEEMPAKLYIQDERVSENAPDKILREKCS